MKQQTIQDIEEDIVEGRTQQARAQLNKVVIAKIPRNRRASLASLCRRVGLAEQALKILRPVVRSQNRQITPSSEESLQYAQSLSSIGGSEEAIRLLSGEKIQKEEPRALLYLAFAHFAQWKYCESLPFLEEFLRQPPPTSYFHHIGEVNLIAALVSVCDYERARAHLLPLIEKLDQAGHRILAGNCRELLGQVLFHMGKTSEAKASLEEALQLLGEHKYPDSLFVKKWQLIIGLREQPSDLNLQHKFSELRAKAMEISHWETLRDIDFNSSKLFSTPELFQHVYFGTPYASYRDYMERDLDLPLPKQFARQMQKAAKGEVIDLDEMIIGSQKPFKVNSLFHRMYHELSLDFYKPKRVATLFSKVYPGEYFDAESSTQKIKMLISRLRKVLGPYGLTVKEWGGTGYSLDATKPCGLLCRLDREAPKSSRSERHFDDFVRFFKGSEFSSQQVAKEFGVTQRTALRWLTEHVENGRLEKIGQKKGARYTVVDQQSSAELVAEGDKVA